MDWNNVKLTDGYERDQNIIDPLSFADLLLEIDCNISEIDEEKIRSQFELDLKARISSAREILEANLKNITAQAKKERKEKSKK